MDLRSWVIDDLKSLGIKLDKGILGTIPPSGGASASTAAASPPVTSSGIWRAITTWPSTPCSGTCPRWSKAGPTASEFTTISGGGLAEGEDQDLVSELDPESVGGYALAVIDNTAGWLKGGRSGSSGHDA